MSVRERACKPHPSGRTGPTLASSRQQDVFSIVEGTFYSYAVKRLGDQQLHAPPPLRPDPTPAVGFRSYLLLSIAAWRLLPASFLPLAADKPPRTNRPL